MLKITAYLDQISARPEDKLKLMVNCQYPSYTAEVVRIVHGDTSPESPDLRILPTDKVVHELVGRKQTILAGSFGLIEGIPTHVSRDGITFQTYIYPTTPTKGAQSIISMFDPVSRTGIELGIEEGATVFTYITPQGTWKVISRVKLIAKQWYLVAGSYDPVTGLLKVYQLPLAPIPTMMAEDIREIPTRDLSDLQLPLGTPFTLAARWSGLDANRPSATCFFNGKIDRPRVLNRAVGLATMRAMQDDSGSEQDEGLVVAAWDFAREIKTDRIIDSGPSALHGRLINLPARGVTGHNYSGEEHCWEHNPKQWSAVHFHDDDLYDAAWQVDLEYTIPADVKSGIYAFRLISGTEEQFVTFVVKPPKGKTTAKLLYLFPSATYMAYANEHFGTNDGLVELHLNRALVLHPHQVFLNEHREYGHSLYDLHSDGSGVYYSSRLRPVLNMRPKLESNHGARPSNLWLFNADTHITDWLEHLDIDYDVITDEDLHHEGQDALAPYQAVITATHPEYYTKEMWEGVFNYTRAGGRLMYMGGNGFYWRIAFSKSQPGVIETRRAEGGSRAWEPPTGEYYHSFTGEYGGMWRRQGSRSPNHLVGIGFAAQGFDESSAYRRQPGADDPRVSFAFEGIQDEILGDFGLIGGGAAGMEVDRYDPSNGSPLHGIVLASSEPHTQAHMLVLEDMLFNFMGASGDICDKVRSDIVFFETGNGGAVFSVGSIAYSSALSHNQYRNNISKLTENVVRRFLSADPF